MTFTPLMFKNLSFSEVVESMAEPCSCGWCMWCAEHDVPPKPIPEHELAIENRELRRLVLAMADRIADQSELLAKRAEKVDKESKS